MLFQNLNRREWQNLGFAAIITVILVSLGTQILQDDLFLGYGFDYLAFSSVGHIANTDGYGHAYDLDYIAGVQQTMVQGNISPAPTAFLPLFIVPFQLLAKFDPLTGYFLWSAGSFAVYLCYFYFIYFRDRPHRDRRRLTLIMILPYPFFITLLEGQVNGWLAIFLAEYIRSQKHQAPFKAGLWLGGLLWKPQLLILIVPFLVFRKAWKEINGFALSLGGILIASLLIGGWSCIRKLLLLWIGFMEGLPTNSPGSMMNWRMLDELLSGTVSPLWSWGFAGAGIVLTVLTTIRMWQLFKRGHACQHKSANQVALIWCILGTFAATSAVTWHSHLHTGLILAPAIVLLYAASAVDNLTFNLWIFFPYGILLLSLFISAQFENVPIIADSNTVKSLIGLGGLSLNIFMLFQAFRNVQSVERKAAD